MDEIESSTADGKYDVMELTASISAGRKTREMLQERFMFGFLHDLFILKWKLFARRHVLYAYS